MAKEKRSFFEWLTGSSDLGAEYSFDDLESGTAFPIRREVGEKPAPQTPPAAPHAMPHAYAPQARPMPSAPPQMGPRTIANSLPSEEPEGELAVDVYQTPTHIIVKAMIAGVRPDNLDVTIARDSVSIRGKREQISESNDEHFYYQELYWGAFSRTIALPQEVDTESAEASERHGLLIIRLPKLDKSRQMKLKVRSN
ncbi:MAG: Hsp20/alpha crystallin family protein [Minisyncoccia bacterium]